MVSQSYSGGNEQMAQDMENWFLFAFLGAGGDWRSKRQEVIYTVDRECSFKHVFGLDFSHSHVLPMVQFIFMLCVRLRKLSSVHCDPCVICESFERTFKVLSHTHRWLYSRAY